MKRKIPFNTNAYTAKLIGRENVSTLNGAILELVKNAYDANANDCVLYYESSSDILYIMDNGDGMSEDTILTHWMTIGNSSKHTNYVTKKGRIQTGAKGIGRFALDRIGDKCTMFTKTNNKKETIEWSVDWSDFDRSIKLTEVEAEIDITNRNLLDITKNIKNTSVAEIMKNRFDKSGTLFKISLLREEWNESLIKSVMESLSSLLPPHIEEVFKIYFFKEETKAEDAQILSKGISDYDYKIEFECNNNEVTIQINRNEYNLGESIDDIIKETDLTIQDKKYFLGEKIIIKKTISQLTNEKVAQDIGDFSGELYFNKIKMSGGDKDIYYYKDITGRKNYAEEFGGIKIYRDNFRVRPYGEIKSSGYDWLLLGLRHASSPASVSHKSGRWRVIPQQMCGIVNISRVNIHLPDQSNREGIVETKQFIGLKEVILSIIDTFEEDRQRVARELKKYYEITHPTELIVEDISTKAKIEEKNRKKGIIDSKEDTRVSALDVQSVIEEKNAEIEELETEKELLRNLATIGIASIQYVHETKESVNNIKNNILAAVEALEFDNDVETAKRMLEKSQGNISNMSLWLGVTLGAVKKDKRLRRQVDINILLDEYVNRWAKILSGKKIKLHLETNQIGLFRCLPYEIESILTNLIINSVRALNMVDDKKIYLSVKKENESISILYQDNGKGLSQKYKSNPDRILEPFETDIVNDSGEKIGTGMGMWIIKTIVQSYNGTIDLDENKKLMDGFKIKIII